LQLVSNTAPDGNDTVLTGLKAMHVISHLKKYTF
jgi:hypothetical protein